MKQKIFLGIGILLLTVFGFSIYQEFMANHVYYYDMFKNRQNWKTIIFGIISLIFPLGYILRSGKISLKKLALIRIPTGVIFFGLAQVLIRGDAQGVRQVGFIMFIINNLIIYFLSVYFITGLTALGTAINKLRIKLSHQRIQELFINFGIGLGAFLLLIKILVSLTILYGIISRFLFILLGVGVYLYRKDLSIYKDLIENTLGEFSQEKAKTNNILRIGITLIGLSLLYYFYGFQASFIPYSTAWDANHAYMYIPKVLAENHGVLRGNVGIASTAPQLRHAFITFWFSLIGSIKWFWLAPDTIAAAMNFLSGILVLILGIGTVKEVITFFTKKESEASELAFYLGRFLILLWLTSGMGAFLVFVDNKTDLGVMAITMLGMLSGFIFLNYIKEHANSKKEIGKYIIISGIFFALASMSKQTAFIDIVLFGLLLVALWMNSILAIGLGILITGATGIMQIANAKDLINPAFGKQIAIVGGIITVIGIIKYILNKDKFKKAFKYIGLWIGGSIITIILFKGPFLLYEQIKFSDFNTKNFVKTLLLATSTNTQQLKEQTNIDQSQKNNLSPEQCKEISFSKEELEKNKKKAIVGNEDVGRYVGYGQKEFDKPGLGYGLLRLIYPKDNTCYGANKDAKILCKNSEIIKNFNLEEIEKIASTLNPKSNAYNVVSTAIKSAQEKIKAGNNGSGNEFRDEIVAIKQYYENHSIKTASGKIFIPYRYIIPLNISFNRSLQNLSSYYTDIGFIWLFTIIFIILGLVYGLIKKSSTLISITSITILGWAIRRIIGGGILRYGLGLVIWTIIGSIMYIHELIEDSESTETDAYMLYFFLFLLTIWGVLQVFFNLIRISSQGSRGPFTRYKMSTGKTNGLNEYLQQTSDSESVKTNYRRKDVFDLQFPHYNKFIELTKNRKDEDGVLIAGTYIQYWLNNQRNIINDGLLSYLWEEMSDNDSCKTSQRLKNKHIKYFVIDPNIGTVGMGEGNETLIHRFFAKLDPVTGKIESHGVISMLIKMNQEGFLKLINTNNLGAKYAFTLSDAEIKAYFGEMNKDEIILQRAKLAVAKYFEDANKYINFVATKFLERLGNGKAVGDIADIFGKNINENKVLQAIETLSKSEKITTETLKSATSNLTEDERLVLAQYINILGASKTGNAESLREVLNGLLSQSLGSSSQLITLELTQ